MDRAILSVEFHIPGFSDRHFEYCADQSLLDADIVVFQPRTLYRPGERGKISFDDSASFEIQQSTGHWRRELLTALEYGKTVFLVLGKHEVASVQTGRKDVKGRTTINYVMDFNNYEFLPVTLPPIISKSGNEILFTGDPVFARFWKMFGKYLKFECYLNEKVKRPIFVTKTGEKPTGAVFSVKKGHLVLLPMLDYNIDKFTKQYKGREHHWTQEALTFGRTLVSILLEIDTSLRSESTETPPPIWTKDSAFISSGETRLLEAIAVTEKTAHELTRRQESLRSDLKQEQKLKNLLFETGKRLEAAVIAALQVLGYSAENYNDGKLELDQIIVSPEGERFIGECEGKDNSAVNIDKFRQLAENIQADFQREQVRQPAIGILFANGFRLTAPKDRQEQFTEKCLLSAQRGSILVRTMDLYTIVRYIEESNDESYKKSCRAAILAGIGGIVKFPTPPHS